MGDTKTKRPMFLGHITVLLRLTSWKNDALIGRPLRVSKSAYTMPNQSP
jgi:hypothetical protein